ncbi:MAG: lytic transglycosylase domain-containing protein, partial [Candidatus Veblenbacteria bacterium]|nr:lytic transglycosylase domain-containing protein [Candidatus Veblenbacteria bacterium]
MKTKLVIWSLVVLVATGIFFHGGCSTGTEGDRVWETKFSAMLHDSLVVLRNEYFSRLPVLVVNSRLASAWQLDTAGTFEFCGQAYDLSDAAFRERLQDELWYLYDRQGWLLTQAQRLGRYRNLIEAQLAIDTMPKDLTYLYVWESGLNPTAVSWAGATGISQFIQSTGRAFRLHISSQYDERKDPGPAITASVHYLKNLYGEFGDWLLVLASYNHGETAVRNRL